MSKLFEDDDIPVIDSFSQVKLPNEKNDTLKNSKDNIRDKEIKKIESLKKIFETSRITWTESIEEIKERFDDFENFRNILPKILYSNRQILVEQKSKLFVTLSRLNRILAERRLTYFEESLTNYQYDLKTNSEKNMYIDSKCSLLSEQISLVENQINFLSETMKTYDSLIYAIKHRIEFEKIRMGFS